MHRGARQKVSQPCKIGCVGFGCSEFVMDCGKDVGFAGAWISVLVAGEGGFYVPGQKSEKKSSVRFAFVYL